MRTLLQAAGIASLDDLAGLPPPDDQQTYREAGLVLNLDISCACPPPPSPHPINGAGAPPPPPSPTAHPTLPPSPAADTNFYLTGRGVEVGTGSFDRGRVMYTYRVSTVPQTEYKFITSSAPFPTADNTARELVNRHGVRILVTTSGRIGYFDAMTFLINLNVAAGLLGLSYLLMDMLVTQCCPLRSVYRQFKERQTVDISDLRKAAREDPAALSTLLREFEDNPYMVDAPPSALVEAMGAYKPRSALKLRREGGEGEGEAEEGAGGGGGSAWQAEGRKEAEGGGRGGGERLTRPLLG